MTIIVVACLATLALCALFARVGQPTVVRPQKVPTLDHALTSLIQEVTREPEPRRPAYVDHVHIGSRLRAMDRSSQRITAV